MLLCQGKQHRVGEATSRHEIPRAERVGGCFQYLWKPKAAAAATAGS